MMLRADALPQHVGGVIVTRSTKGRIVTSTPVLSAIANPPGCWQHTHINRNACYDNGEILEVL